MVVVFCESAVSKRFPDSIMVQVKIMRKISALRFVVHPNQRQSGMTFLEILLALAIVTILLAIAVPNYQRYITRARNAQAMADVAEIETLIVRFYSGSTGRVPDDLDEVGMADKRDPWDRPYRFLNLLTLKDKGSEGQPRRDKKLKPINSDFDLYSVGADGASIASLNAEESRDDIVRANNGRFIGLGKDY